MRFLHGTTADCLPSILANGLLTTEGGANWTVSDEYVYFWSPNALKKHGEADDLESALYIARQRAFESAQMALGFAKDCRAVIIEVELTGKGNLPVDDESCSGMQGAVRTADSVPLSVIKSIRVSPDLSLLKGVFLSYMLNRDMAARTMTAIERRVAEAMAKAEICFDTIEEIAGAWEDWEEISLAK